MCRAKFIRAFTLVELLVVIGVIALLISILLPVLAAARRSSETAACSSNMKQVAVALRMYADDNKGLLMPFYILIGNAAQPQGQFWADDLVRGRYLVAPDAGVTWDADSVFRCASGIGDEASMPSGYWLQRNPGPPYEIYNLWHAYNFAGGTFGDYMNEGTPQGIDGYMVRSWYATNAGRESDQRPFIRIRSDSNLQGSPATYRKRMSQVRKVSEMVLLVEGRRYRGSSNIYPAHIAPRHGQRHIVNGNTEAYTNLAFFDGHVATFDTGLFQNDNQIENYTRDTIFRLDRQ
jgi:prepilin-type N-terminal cleavage/methylation domain-containing protein/prepilin-type processing-associated H-X9-DG protein